MDFVNLFYTDIDQTKLRPYMTISDRTIPDHTENRSHRDQTTQGPDHTETRPHGDQTTQRQSSYFVVSFTHVKEYMSEIKFQDFRAKTS